MKLFEFLNTLNASETVQIIGKSKTIFTGTVKEFYNLPMFASLIVFKNVFDTYFKNNTRIIELEITK